MQTERNGYDRVVHFAFGVVLAYSQREILKRKAGLRGVWLYSLPILMTLAWSAGYEILESIVASIVDPMDAAAFLGSQGDQWDSQKDMFMGLIGSSLCMSVVAACNRSRKGSASPASDLHKDDTRN
jgi:putative membrane protein